ncbi:hypothetical protein LM597_00455 [Candidatus Acetothermia bacterium]|nr:hypothetical protein [Candidatus Acetothermia bacterium]
MIQRNKWRTAFLVVILLVIWGSFASAGWLQLDLHPAVDLGTINAGNFVGITPLGEGLFTPLQSTGNEVWIRLSDGCPGSVGMLSIQLFSASRNVDITRFKWKGGDQRDYIAFPAMRTWMEVAQVSGANWDRTFMMSYRYYPTTADQHGNYEVRLRFRLRLYVDGERDDAILEIPIPIYWNALSWVALHIPTADRTVALGTIGPKLFDPTTGVWTPLVSGKKRAWVIANIGFTFRVTARNTGTMPADLARFQMIGGDLATFMSLNVERILASRTTGGFLRITNIRYQYVPSWADPPGAYAVTVTYTITAP